MTAHDGRILWEWTNRDGSERGVSWWCPGCDGYHQVPVKGPKAWGWNRSTSAPTITPSVRTRGGELDGICHCYITDGRIQFLNDCTHTLAGQTVPMVPEPEAKEA